MVVDILVTSQVTKNVLLTTLKILKVSQSSGLTPPKERNMFAPSLLVAIDIPQEVMLMLPQAMFNLAPLLVTVRYQVMLIVSLLHLLSILIMKPGSLILAQRRA